MTAHPMLTTDEPVLRFRTELTGNDAVVHVAGELDLATGPDLARALHALLSYPLSRLVVDLGDLVDVDPAGARVLADAQQRARERGIRMMLRAVNPGPRRVLDEWTGDAAFTFSDREAQTAMPTPATRRRVVHWPDPSGSTRRVHRSRRDGTPSPRRKRDDADVASEH